LAYRVAVEAVLPRQILFPGETLADRIGALGDEGLEAAGELHVKRDWAGFV
jgi:hypothetical protein